MKQNGLEITNKKNYILIEPTERINFFEIMKGIVNLFTMSAYHEKGDIWIFRKGHPNLLYSDFHEIKRFADEHYPETPTTQKTAIVIETELNRELASEYSRLAEDLPRKVRIFTNLTSAEEWITK